MSFKVPTAWCYEALGDPNALNGAIIYLVLLYGCFDFHLNVAHLCMYDATVIHLIGPSLKQESDPQIKIPVQSYQV